MQHLRRSAVLVQVLWFSVFALWLSRCIFLQNFSFMLYLSIQFLFSFKTCWFYAASNLKDAHWCLWWGNMRNQRLLHEVSAARPLLPVQQMTCSECETHRSNGWFPSSAIFVACSPAGLAVLYSWGSTLGFLAPCITLNVSHEPGVLGWFTWNVFWLVSHVFSS